MSGQFPSRPRHDRHGPRRPELDRRALLLLAASGVLAACAPRPEARLADGEMRADIGFSEIRVETVGTGFESRLAADAAARLGPDLQAELRREFSDRIDRGGTARMVVEIDRFNLAGGAQTALGRDQSRLSGTVRVFDDADRLLASRAITVAAGTAAQSRTGAVLGAMTGSADRYYREMLRDFACAAREQMLGPDLPGQRLVRRVTR